MEMFAVVVVVISVESFHGSRAIKELYLEPFYVHMKRYLLNYFPYFFEIGVKKT